MKRYYLSALTLVVLASGCSKQSGSHAHHGTQQAAHEAQQSSSAQMAKEMPDAQQTQQQAALRDAQSGVLPESEQAATDASGAWKYDREDREKLALPPPSEKRGLATSSGGIVTSPPPDATPAELPSYGNPPGAFVEPGNVRAVRPSQGTSDQATRKPGADEAEDDGESTTPTEADRLTTQRIRTALRANPALSYTAKSIEIITRKGNITLKGMVLTDRERWEIERTARAYAGDGKVRNRLEIKNAMAPRE